MRLVSALKLAVSIACWHHLLLYAIADTKTLLQTLGKLASDLDYALDLEGLQQPQQQQRF